MYGMSEEEESEEESENCGSSSLEKSECFPSVKSEKPISSEV